MRSDEPDVDDPIGIVDPDHDPVLIPRDIEDDPAVFENADAANIPFHIRRFRPIRLPHLPEPGHRWLARIDDAGTTIEKGLDRAKRYHPHQLSLT